MCDTFVALADATPGGEVIFGKNSDRPGGEIQDVLAIPAQRYRAQDTLIRTSCLLPFLDK